MPMIQRSGSFVHLPPEVTSTPSLTSFCPGLHALFCEERLQFCAAGKVVEDVSSIHALLLTYCLVVFTVTSWATLIGLVFGAMWLGSYAVEVQVLPEGSRFSLFLVFVNPSSLQVLVTLCVDMPDGVGVEVVELSGWSALRYYTHLKIRRAKDAIMDARYRIGSQLMNYASGRRRHV